MHALPNFDQDLIPAWSVSSVFTLPLVNYFEAHSTYYINLSTYYLNGYQKYNKSFKDVSSTAVTKFAPIES